MNSHPFGPSEMSIRLGRLYDIQRKLMHHIFWVSYEYDWPGERTVLEPNDRYTDRRCKLLFAIQSEIRDIEIFRDEEWYYDTQVEYRNNIISEFGI